MAKRYYWLKLHEDFFQSKRMKMVRSIAGGDTYTIIYLKMMLLALRENGYICYEKVAKTPEEEVALSIDERPEDVKLGIKLLISIGAVEVIDNNYFIHETVENTGSETASAKRMRRSRSTLVYDKTSHCDTEKRREEKKRKDIDIDIDKREEERREDTEKDIEKKKKTRRFKPPTLQEVEAYCQEKGLCINPEIFVDYYEGNGWKVGKNPMKSWKATLRNWDRRELKDGRSQSPEPIAGGYFELLTEEERNGQSGNG